MSLISQVIYSPKIVKSDGMFRYEWQIEGNSDPLYWTVTDISNLEDDTRLRRYVELLKHFLKGKDLSLTAYLRPDDSKYNYLIYVRQAQLRDLKGSGRATTSMWIVRFDKQVKVTLSNLLAITDGPIPITVPNRLPESLSQSLIEEFAQLREDGKYSHGKRTIETNQVQKLLLDVTIDEQYLPEYSVTRAPSSEVDIPLLVSLLHRQGFNTKNPFNFYSSERSTELRHLSCYNSLLGAHLRGNNLSLEDPPQFCICSFTDNTHSASLDGLQELAGELYIKVNYGQSVTINIPKLPLANFYSEPLITQMYPNLGNMDFGDIDHPTIIRIFDSNLALRLRLQTIIWATKYGNVEHADEYADLLHRLVNSSRANEIFLEFMKLRDSVESRTDLDYLDNLIQKLDLKQRANAYMLPPINLERNQNRNFDEFANSEQKINSPSIKGLFANAWILVIVAIILCVLGIISFSVYTQNRNAQIVAETQFVIATSQAQETSISITQSALNDLATQQVSQTQAQSITFATNTQVSRNATATVLVQTQTQQFFAVSGTMTAIVQTPTPQLINPAGTTFGNCTIWPREGTDSNARIRREITKQSNNALGLVPNIETNRDVIVLGILWSEPDDNNILSADWLYVYRRFTENTLVQHMVGWVSADEIIFVGDCTDVRLITEDIVETLPTSPQVSPATQPEFGFENIIPTLPAAFQANTIYAIPIGIGRDETQNPDRTVTRFNLLHGLDSPITVECDASCTLLVTDPFDNMLSAQVQGGIQDFVVPNADASYVVIRVPDSTQNRTVVNVFIALGN